ncbi:MAG: VanZ family protein [Candidatus Poribacteria bacterium]
MPRGGIRLKVVKAVGAWSLVLLYMYLLYWLSSRSSTGGGGMPIPDKLAHAVAYFGLCVVVRLATGATVSKATAATGLAVGITMLYGATDEWHQSFTPGRQPDVLDWVADSVGALTAAAVWILVGRITRGSSKQVSY